MSSAVRPPNYDEELVPHYEVPDLLVSEAGDPITGSDSWEQTRRPEVLELLTAYEYGALFPPPDELLVHDHSTWVRDGIRFDQSRVELRVRDGILPFHLLVAAPTTGLTRATFAGLNFRGNHTIATDREIWLPEAWVPQEGISQGHSAADRDRGAHLSRWPLELITGRGYSVATVYCGDFDPDYDDGFQNGVHGLFPRERSEDTPGTITAWAWGLSRVLDALVSEHADSSAPIVAIGHSRLGKTALWSAANDRRFGGAISNESGCGGAALTRRCYGETIEAITARFPHWFAPSFARFAGRDESLPVDQHMLLAAIAPRPLAVGSAAGDRWADPRGEFLSLVNATSAYRLFGVRPGLPFQLPAVDESVGEAVHYHIRSGDHDITRDDWVHYLAYLDRVL